MNRDGLSKLYMKLSDRTWEDAIDLIKYMAKRGMKMSFGELNSKDNNKVSNLHSNNIWLGFLRNPLK